MRSLWFTQYLSCLLLLGGAGLSSCHLPRETLTEVNLFLSTPAQFITDINNRSEPTTAHFFSPTETEENELHARQDGTPPPEATDGGSKGVDVPPWHEFSHTNIGCVDQASPGRPIDVNFPDDTIVSPGQEFTKIWRLVNSGTCTWTPAYEVFWLWGEKMGAADAYPLPRSVAPGEEIDISISFIAPSTPGVYQSNWKLRNPLGKVFGLGSGEGLYFYVRVVVEENEETISSSEQHQNGAGNFGTSTPLPSSSTRLLPGDRIDLDANILNPSQGADVVFTVSKPHLLVPYSGVYLSVFGENEPTLTDCLSAEPARNAIDVSSLAAGTFVCYQTDQGRSGWIQILHYWSFQNRAILNIATFSFT